MVLIDKTSTVPGLSPALEGTHRGIWSTLKHPVYPALLVMLVVQIYASWHCFVAPPLSAIEGPEQFDATRASEHLKKLAALGIHSSKYSFAIV